MIIYVNITVEQSNLKVLLVIFCSLIANNSAGSLTIMTYARMILIFRSICTLKFIANCRHLISTPEKVFIKHKNYKICLFNTDKLTLAREDTALSKNSWEVLRGGGSIV